MSNKELIDNLRRGSHKAEPFTLGGVEHDARCLAAADAIDHLRADNARLREALASIRDLSRDGEMFAQLKACNAKAREALEGKG